MKTQHPFLSTLLTLLLLIIAIPTAEGQLLKKLKKRAEKAAEEAVIRKTEEKVYKETSKGMDSILNPKTGKMEPAPPPAPPSPDNKNPDGNNSNSGTNSGASSIQVYSKFDYVPGDKLLFFDDFSNDFIGDFPAKWNTNGSGEVVTINDSPQKWLKILPGHATYYIPDVPSLPEEYTIEFDVLALGIDRQTSSTATLQVELSENNQFSQGSAFAYALIPFCQYSPIGVRVRNFTRNGSGTKINNVVNADLREAVLNQPHISIAVNKQRFRLWVNEKKYVDIPRMIPPENVITALKFHLNSFKDGKESLYISNLKVAEGGLDLRRTLIADGRVSTNGILFDSGSANIKPQSMGIIRQISQVLIQEKSMRLKIVGHTDADGDNALNLTLSQERAAAVKQALVDFYNIAPDRLETDGKGESEPVGNNSTADGKAKNRRVEFIKQ